MSFTLIGLRIFEELTIHRKSQAEKHVAQYSAVRNAENTEVLQKRSAGKLLCCVRWGEEDLCQEQTVQKEQEALSN